MIFFILSRSIDSISDVTENLGGKKRNEKAILKYDICTTSTPYLNTTKKRRTVSVSGG